MKRQFLLAGLGLALATGAMAQSATAPSGQAAATATAVTTAQQFVPIAAASNMFEIESSRLALQKSQSAGVKSFAQEMIDDHTKATKEMQAVLAKANLAAPAAMDARHQQMVTQLNSASGAQFDQAYMTMQLQAHQEAVALFTSYSQGGDNPDLKAFATKTLPTLKEHLAMVQKAQKGS